MSVIRKEGKDLYFVLREVDHIKKVYLKTLSNQQERRMNIVPLWLGAVQVLRNNFLSFLGPPSPYCNQM